METPITWGSSETPSATENAAINQLRRKKGPQWEAKQQKNTGTIRAVYLLGPSKQPMAFRKLPRTKRFSLHQTVLETQLHGSHMALFPYWIANLLTIEQAGSLLQELTTQTAVLTARTHAGQYEINQSILDKIDRMAEGENQKEGETNERGQIKPE